MSLSASGPAGKFLDDQKSLACIHCGLCLSSCPTYLITGNENDSPRGRIYLMRAFQDARLPLEDASVRHVDLCLGCRACEAVCPSGVQYGELLECTREHVEGAYRRSWFETFLRRVAIEKVFPFPRRLRIALIPAWFARLIGLDRWGPRRIREALALLPEERAGEPLPRFSPAIGKSRGRVTFIEGCVMPVLFARTNENSVWLLNRAGFDVAIPAGQGCCGALYAHGGSLEKARALARRTIEIFEAAGKDPVIINAAGCGSTLKEYGHLLAGDPAWAERGRQFSSRVKDLTEWLSLHGVEIPARATRRVTYHDACHLAHPQRITRQPRDLVRAAAGNQFVELAESDVCCGSAGSYNLTEPEMARRLQERKIGNIIRSGADVVVTSNPGCLLQIQAGLRQAGSSIEALHIADYLRQEITSA